MSLNNSNEMCFRAEGADQGEITIDWLVDSIKELEEKIEDISKIVERSRGLKVKMNVQIGYRC
ncbi:hypothetical protein [Clostridium massiliamazoniense]|uniref:hypothetical protein n=1 Tax=Clostridium massiliamazoniense TaxID=1347366 RepID=UPI0006D804D8|nr:hypothetical protein [Clostridium massiliamazoniense]